MYGNRILNIQASLEIVHNSTCAGTCLNCSLSNLKVKKFHHPMAIKSSFSLLGLVSKCIIPYLPKIVILSPLHGFAFYQITISFCAF